MSSALNVNWHFNAKWFWGWEEGKGGGSHLIEIHMSISVAITILDMLLAGLVVILCGSVNEAKSLLKFNLLNKMT